MTTLMKDTHPKLFEAFEEIAFDNGAWRDLDNLEGRFVTETSAENCRKAELILAELTEDDFTEFCIGEETLMLEIRNRFPDLGIAHKILCEFFDRL